MGMTLIPGRDKKGKPQLILISSCDNCCKPFPIKKLRWHWKEIEGQISESKLLCFECGQKFPDLKETGRTDYMMVNGWNDLVKTTLSQGGK